jgi:hypothetical protein
MKIICEFPSSFLFVILDSYSFIKLVISVHFCMSLYIHTLLSNKLSFLLLNTHFSFQSISLCFLYEPFSLLLNSLAKRQSDS